jgi:ribosomal protein S18 acetylase RimI-like enzyme
MLEFYFLRSSEQKIVTDTLKCIYGADAQNIESFNIYHEYYGLTPKDLGLYAMLNNQVVGAIWSRKFQPYHNAKGFIDEHTPILHCCVHPDFRNQGVGSAMVEKFLEEASSLYEALSITLTKDEKSIKFFQKFGFTQVAQEENYVVMRVQLIKKENKPYEMDDFSNCKWLD